MTKTKDEVAVDKRYDQAMELMGLSDDAYFCLFCGVDLSEDENLWCTRCRPVRCPENPIIEKREKSILYCHNCGEILRGSRRKWCSDYCKPKQPTKSSPASLSELFIFDRDNFQCIYCGRSPVDYDIQLHGEHIVPVSGGGMDTAGNLVTACRDCNSTKKAKRLMNEQMILDAVSERNERFGIEDDLVVKLFAADDRRRR